MPASVTSGGQNKTTIHAISSNAVTAAAEITLENIVTSQVQAWLNGTAGGKILFTQNQNNNALTTFLAANISTSSEDAQKGKFQNGTEFTVSEATSPALYIVHYGTTADGNVQTFHGCIKIVNPGDLSMSYNTEIQRNFECVAVEWNGSANLSLPAGMWDATIVDTTPVTIQLPTELTIGVASVEAWYEAA